MLSGWQCDVSNSLCVWLAGRGLLQLAHGNFADAYEYFKKLTERDTSNVVVCRLLLILHRNANKSTGVYVGCDDDGGGLLLDVLHLKFWWWRTTVTVWRLLIFCGSASAVQTSDFLYEYNFTHARYITVT